MARREKQLNSLSIKAEKYKCGEIRMREKERVLESQTGEFNTIIYTQYGCWAL